MEKMNKRLFWTALAALGLALAQEKAPDPAQHGFPQVVASIVLNPLDYLRLGLGNVVLTVPDKAFGQDPVRLELLTGDPTSWQAKAPKGQRVVYAFALRVTDLKTGERILRFARPLHFSYYGKEITAEAGYFDVSLTDSPQVSPNPVKPSIQVFRLGTRHQTGRLAHPLAGATVGWLITVPAR
ncbi:hypothetical protein [Thermus sp.]|uniref:hypothetical protein n=1 Tax=Thermus sp. TaxID=275 RepID=UPI003D0AB884